MGYNYNLVSNELGFQNVIPYFQQNIEVHGIYIGVGPDQNFTYISSTRPAFAFIIDIRKENQLLHYLFKACFELASSSQEYLSLLFSKPLVNRLSSLRDIVYNFSKIEGDRNIFDKNWILLSQIIQKYREGVSKIEMEKIHSIYNNYFEYHLMLRTRDDAESWQGWPYPTYKDYLLTTDPFGHCWNFLNDESSFLWLKNMQIKNRIVPIIGDLTGKKALKAIADFAVQRGKKISTVYVSNSEKYIFNNHLFNQYMINITHLPIAERSLLIRAVANRPEQLHPEFREGQIVSSVAQRIKSFIQLYKNSQYNTYWDVATLDYL